MQYRTLGKANIQISEIGFGAWGIGGEMWQESDDAESMHALHEAVDRGINFIDTALAYGRGHSERLIKKLLQERSEQIFVATKIPPKNRKWPAEPGLPITEVFPPDYIRKCTENSLQNFGVDCIDVQQFHVWQDEWLGEEEWFKTIEELKKTGKIRCFGISINDHAPETALRAVEEGIVDSVQVIYNIFDQSPDDELFALCMESNVGVIVRVPFDEGGLTGTVTPDTVFPPRDWRNRYFTGDRKRQVYERVKKLESLLGNEAATLPELALRFCLSHPAVSTVIPGMRTVEHVEANCRVSDGRTLSPGLKAELKKHEWRRNFY